MAVSLPRYPCSRALFCWLLSLWLFSCAGSYVMLGVQAPLFERAGEVEASANDNGAMIDYLGHVGWSPLGGLALLGAVSWIPRPSSLSDSVLDAGFPLYGYASVEALYLEGAAGWYGRPDRPDGLRYELFAGYGAGSSVMLDPNYDSTTKGFEQVSGRYRRLFLQADIGKSAMVLQPWLGLGDNARSAMGGSLRVAWVWFTDFTGVAGSGAKPRGLFLEPAWFMRGGPPLLQLEVQGGIGVRLLGKEEMTWTYFHIDIGLHTSIGEW